MPCLSSAPGGWRPRPSASRPRPPGGRSQTPSCRPASHVKQSLGRFWPSPHCAFPYDDEALFAGRLVGAGPGVAKARVLSAARRPPGPGPQHPLPDFKDGGSDTQTDRGVQRGLRVAESTLLYFSPRRGKKTRRRLSKTKIHLITEMGIQLSCFSCESGPIIGP